MYTSAFSGLFAVTEIVLDFQIQKKSPFRATFINSITQQPQRS